MPVANLYPARTPSEIFSSVELLLQRDRSNEGQCESSRWRRAGWEEGGKDGQVVAGLLAYKVDCLVEDVAAGGCRGGLLLVGHDRLMEKESRVEA